MDATQAAAQSANVGQQLSSIFTVPPQTAGATTASAASAASDSLTANSTEDRFLKLLVAQMRNQDPLNPLDNAQVTTQLAQISTVRGIEDLKRAMEKMAGGAGISSPIQAIGLIGRDLLTEGSGFEVTDASPAKITAGFELANAADAVSLQIVNAAGEPVFSQILGQTQAGVQLFQWDRGDAPVGAYQLKVRALASGQEFAATPLTPAQVIGVSQGTDGVRIELSGRAGIAASAIKAVL